jgi:hypothetical protein
MWACFSVLWAFWRDLNRNLPEEVPHEFAADDIFCLPFPYLRYGIEKAKDMKKYIIVLILVSGAIMAFSPKLKMVKELKPGPKLKFQNQESGTYANAVVYNPLLNLYYASYGGNETYPLETFDKKGKVLYSTTTGADMRGMWWNPKTEKLEGNCFSDGGIVSVEIREDGYAGGSPKTIFKGRLQPDDQSAGAFDYVDNQVLYYFEGKIYKYGRLNGNYIEAMKLRNMPAKFDDIDYNTLIFTGQEGVEIGILNYVAKEIYFFDKKTGEYTKTMKLPADAPTSDRMRFAFANNYVWLYDHSVRTWIGYKLFK